MVLLPHSRHPMNNAGIILFRRLAVWWDCEWCRVVQSVEFEVDSQFTLSIPQGKSVSIATLVSSSITNISSKWYVSSQPGVSEIEDEERRGTRERTDSEERRCGNTMIGDDKGMGKEMEWVVGRSRGTDFQADKTAAVNPMKELRIEKLVISAWICIWKSKSYS
jgi:hypothetical protein